MTLILSDFLKALVPVLIFKRDEQGWHFLIFEFFFLPDGTKL